MVGSRRLIYAMYFTALFHVSGCMAGSFGVSVKVNLPGDKVTQAFTGNAQAHIPGEVEADPKSVFNRVMDGFELNPQRLKLEDGSPMYWGAK